MAPAQPTTSRTSDITPTAARQQPRLRRIASKPLRIGRSIKKGLSTGTGRANKSTSNLAVMADSSASSSCVGVNATISGLNSHETLPINGGLGGAEERAIVARGRTKPLDGEEPVVTLRVKVVRCEGLAAKDKSGTSDPFITLTLPPTPRQQTPVIRRSLAPDYTTSSATSAKSTFDFPLYKSLAQSGYYGGRGLELVVWDKDLMRKEYMGEVSIPITKWFGNGDQDNFGHAAAWSDDLPMRVFPLLSTRRRSTATGSVYLQFGLLANGGGDVEKRWLELAQHSYCGLASLMGVPAYEGIGTVKIRKRRAAGSSSQTTTAKGVLQAARTAFFSSTALSAPMDSPASQEDADELDEEDEELRDDGLSSSSSDDEDEELDDHFARVPIRESSAEAEEGIAIAERNTSDNAASSSSALAVSPALHVEDTETGERQRLTRIESPPKPQRDDSASSVASNSLPTEGKLPSYFDILPPGKTKRRAFSNHSSAVGTPALTPGGVLPGSGAMTPGTVTPGAITPGGRRRRPIFRKHKSRGTHYNFSNENDILGIVMLEVQGAEDLPKLRNSLKFSFDMDPFVVISFGKKVFRTRVIRHSLNPTWDEKLLFHVRRFEDAFSLHFSVLDWDKVSGNDFIGSNTIPLSELVADAPKPDPETGLYDANEDGKHEMKDYKLPIVTAKDTGWEAKHSPKLLLRAKYEPYDALRQRFWRQYCAQYDSDDTGTMSYMELTTMLDSLSSTLTQPTIESYFRSFDKSPESDELTIEEVIICLEREIKKTADEKNRVDLDGDTSPDIQTPADYSIAPKPAGEGLGTAGPMPPLPLPLNADELAKQIEASAPRSDNDDSPNGDINVRPLRAGSASDATPKNTKSSSVSPSMSRAESESEEAKTDSPGDTMERVVNIKSCPLCHRPRLNAKSETDIITHLAVCASADWSRVDRIVVGNYVTASQAQRKFLSKVITKVASGAYSLGANSANIIVQDRATGQLLEEKMAVYVRLGIRVLYKGAKRGMEGSRARRLLRSMSVKQGKKYDSPLSAAEIPAFIAFHKLNIDEIRDPLDSFKTFNEFFYRRLKAEARPIASPNDPNVAVSCADSRMMAFETVSEATRIWIKGREFSVARLLGDAYKGQFDAYEGGALGIFRLAPQDYHRFHSPVDGVVGQCSDIAGEYYTVNPQAIRTTLDVYGENVRKVVPIDSPSFGRVMTVWVGAMMVGSIGSTVKEGDTVKRGDELGWFAFGGSTIVLLFEKGALRWDEDLLNNSRASIETLVKMGTHVGTAVRKNSDPVKQVELLS